MTVTATSPGPEESAATESAPAKAAEDVHQSSADAAERQAFRDELLPVHLRMNYAVVDDANRVNTSFTPFLTSSGGGFSLAKPAHEVSLLDVIEIIDNFITVP